MKPITNLDMLRWDVEAAKEHESAALLLSDSLEEAYEARHFWFLAVLSLLIWVQE